MEFTKKELKQINKGIQDLDNEKTYTHKEVMRMGKKRIAE